VRYVHTYLLANICYTAQIFPAPSRYIRQIITAVTRYIWKGAIFRVPVSTLQRQKNMGEWELVDIDTKCRVLLLCRMPLRSRRVGTATVSWFQTWNLTRPHTNSPHSTRTPNTLAYTHIYAIDMAYINPPGREESSKAFRRRLYITLYVMTVAAKGAREARVMHVQPSTDCPKVWHNLHTA